MKKWGQGFRPAAELLLGVPWLLASLAFSQTTNEVTLTGKITDAITHQPIAGANVTRCCPRVTGATNADGVYRLNVKPGQPAHITGHLLDRDTGEPIAGLQVVASTHNDDEWGSAPSAAAGL